MSLFGRAVLGIAFGSRSLQVAQLRGGNGACRLARAAEFHFGEHDSLQDPIALGRKLALFLKQKGFSARRAVFGMPAQWLMLKEKMLPPAAPETLASMLLIQAERDFSLESSALALDCIVGEPSVGPASLPAGAGGEGQAVVLAAALREKVEQLQTLARAAGLKLSAITSTTLALAAASKEGAVGPASVPADGGGVGVPARRDAGPASNLLYFGAHGAELVTAGKASHGLPRLRAISSGSTGGGDRGRQDAGATTPAPHAAQLSGELRRAMALCQQEVQGVETTVWDDAGVEHAVLEELAAEIKAPLTPGHRLGGLASDAGAVRAAGCAALALCHFKPEYARLDFLHSRLARKPRARFGSRALLGAAALLALVGGGVYMFLDWRQNAAEVADLQQTRDDMKENLEAARSFIGKVNSTSTWYKRRPNYLECMRTVTLCFPEEGARIWTSSLSLREDRRGILNGRATDEKSVLDVLDKLKASPALAEVKMLHMRTSAVGPEVVGRASLPAGPTVPFGPAGGSSKRNEVSFAIGFSFLGAE